MVQPVRRDGVPRVVYHGPWQGVLGPVCHDGPVLGLGCLDQDSEANPGIRGLTLESEANPGIRGLTLESRILKSGILDLSLRGQFH